MRHPVALLSVCFCAGMLGALAGLCAVWSWGMLGLPDVSGQVTRPLLAPDGFYPRLVWGGMWGVLFFLTVGSVRTRKRWIQKGLLVSLIPTLYYLIMILPGQGGFGPDRSMAAPVIVIAVNLVWGVFTGLFSRLFWGRN